jgi:hypothetical protein
MPEIISRVKEGEYVITTYASGHVIKEIDMEGKVIPVEKRKILTRYEFRALFTIEEKAAIITAAKTDLIIEVFHTDMMAAEEIDLAYPDVTQGLAYLVSRELITQEKMNNILEGV